MCVARSRKRDYIDRHIRTNGRALGEVDKRQMYFNLTEAGKKRLDELDLDKVEVPEILKPLM